MTTGADKFGEFEVHHDPDEPCGDCGLAGVTTILYRGALALPIYGEQPLDRMKLVIGGHGKRLGIECGCYSRAHRQIAHIETEQKYPRRR